jgi:hypothetical protein
VELEFFERKTVAHATEAHRRKRHQLEGIKLGVVEPVQQPLTLPSERSLEKQIEHYLAPEAAKQ